MAPPPRRPKRSEDESPSKRRPGAGGDTEERDAKPLPPGIASRSAALDLLRLTGGWRTLDQAIEDCRTFGALEGSDRGFARALASVTLRRRGTLDEVIESYLREPLKPRQNHLRDILRITAAQLCILGTEAHAAAWSAVELCKLRVETKGYTKLVNAIARRMAETGPEKAAAVHIRADTPGWLWRRLAKAYGAKGAERIALAHREEAPLDLTLKNKDTVPAFAEELGPRPMGLRTIRMTTTSVPALPGFEDGAWWVQDLAASLPAEVLGAREGETALDLCAAPGGKALQLAAAGAAVTAVDISGPRLGRLADNFERVGLTAEVVESDVLRWERDTPADAVLLDAPCSATGTIRRNPDILWSAREEQLPELKDLQAKMLDRAADLTRPGGRLVYAVCSLLPEEGEEQVKAFLARRDDFVRTPIAPEEVASLPVVTREGDLRCLPSKLAGDGGMDGFYVARLTRKA
jgi:16S rRNA (cytosine967-C5)-methyltransferase